MANHKSSEKRAKQTIVKTERNRFYKTRIKNITKKFLVAVESKNKEEATEALKVVNSYFHSCVNKGILSKNTASRKVSRLHARVNAL